MKKASDQLAASKGRGRRAQPAPVAYPPVATPKRNPADTPLHRFFWRLVHMSNEQRGYDRTAVLASEDEVKQMVEYAQDPPTDYIGEQIYHALSWDSENGAPRSTQWPAYKVTMANRTLLIARPMASAKSLHGRCTRGYLAYDLTERKVSFLKDFWRPDSPRITAEHEVYKRLAAHKVSNIATCEDSEDVSDSHGQWQVTKTHGAVDHKFPLPYGHYRLRLREVCRPLIDFKEFRELAALLYDAIIGACHYEFFGTNVLLTDALQLTRRPGAGLLSFTETSASTIY